MYNGVYTTRVASQVCTVVYTTRVASQVCTVVYYPGMSLLCVKGCTTRVCLPVYVCEEGFLFSQVIPVSLLVVDNGRPCAAVLSVAGLYTIIHPFHCWVYSLGFIIPVSLLVGVVSPCTVWTVLPPQGRLILLFLTFLIFQRRTNCARQVFPVLAVLLISPGFPRYFLLLSHPK